MVSIFGLSFATATLAKDVSTNNGALTSSKTGEKLSTIAQGGGGVNVPLTPGEEDTQRRLNEEADGYSVLEGTVLQELVWEAHDQATTSNAAVRTTWTDSDGVEHSITIDTNSLTTTPVNGTGAIFTDISVTYANLVPDQSITLQVKVVCADSSDMTCDVYSTSHTLHEAESSPTTRHLRESFPRELFGATEDTIPGESCGLADHTDNDFNINGGGNKIMKVEALKVKNRDLISKILKEATPVSVGNARQFIQAFHKTSEAYASESSGYDLANNNCLHFAIAYLKALGKEMKPHLVWYMAKRLADTIL